MKVREDLAYGNPGYITMGRQPDKLPVGPMVIQPGQQETLFRGYQPADATIVRDRHAVINRGSEKTGRPTNVGGGGFGPDPMKDGPARPSLRLINRSFNPQAGTDKDRNQDDLQRGYRRVSTGQYAGQQDGATTPIWGGTPGFWIPYGSYAGYARGPVVGMQGPEIGAQGDGPQVIPNSPPHGLHSDTVPDRQQSLARYESTIQQRAGRVDRPSNSPIAGQSFSQTVLPQGMQRINVLSPGEGQVNPQKLGGDFWRGS